MKLKKLVTFFTEDRPCVVEEYLASKLCEASMVFRNLVALACEDGESDVKVPFGVCTGKEFYKFASLFVDLLNAADSTPEFRLFHEDTVQEYLYLAWKFDSPSLKKRCCEEICNIIERGNLTLDQIGELFRLAKDHMLFFVFTKTLKYLCTKYSKSNAVDECDNISIDEEIKKILKPKLPIQSVYVVLKLLADYRILVNRFYHEFEFENVCKNVDCIHMAVYCVKCKFTICRSCGTRCNRSEDDNFNYHAEIMICYNCKRPFIDCICSDEKCTKCSKCLENREECEISGHCDAVKISFFSWEDFLAKPR